MLVLGVFVGRPLESAIRPELACAREAVPLRPGPGHEKKDKVLSKEEDRTKRGGFSVAQYIQGTR